MFNANFKNEIQIFRTFKGRIRQQMFNLFVIYKNLNIHYVS